MAQQNYKIFINECQIVLTNNAHLFNSSDFKTIQSTDLIALIQQITSGVYQGPNQLVVPCVKPSATFAVVKKQFKIIKAAGGVVFNEQGELLLIKRLGKWDLPKGKLDPGEDFKLAALREVHEECGLNFLGLSNKLATTYHAYWLKGRWILKKTVWFKMIAWGDASVQPQIEEGITEVVWVNKAFIKAKDFDTYASLKDVFNLIEFSKQP